MWDSTWVARLFRTIHAAPSPVGVLSYLKFQKFCFATSAEVLHNKSNFPMMYAHGQKRIWCELENIQWYRDDTKRCLLRGHAKVCDRMQNLQRYWIGAQEYQCESSFKGMQSFFAKKKHKHYVPLQIKKVFPSHSSKRLPPWNRLMSHKALKTKLATSWIYAL